MDMMNAKQRAIQELLAHLDKRDGDDLGEAMKPKGAGIEVTKVEGLDDKGEPDGDESPGVLPGSDAGAGDSSSPEMSDDEMQELIEAIKSKLGA